MTKTDNKERILKAVRGKEKNNNIHKLTHQNHSRFLNKNIKSKKGIE
jgi:hypothetical protein